MIETEMKSKQTGIQSMERGVVSLTDMFPHTTGKFKSGILRVSEDFYSCVVALESSQVANSVFATAMPTVIPQGKQ